MADKGIIFSAPMVRALLDGRKTQTRRLCAWANNPMSPALTYIVACDEPGWFGDEEGEVQFKVPYAPGDRLYVREAWHAARCLDKTPPRDIPRDADIEHAASARSYAEIGLKGKLRPGMLLPRWASRLWLAVTEVRVQRLQDISEADAIAEGAEYGYGKGAAISQRRMFELLWNSLHTAPGETWEANPWVCAISFTCNHGNIDR